MHKLLAPVLLAIYVAMPGVGAAAPVAMEFPLVTKVSSDGILAAQVIRPPFSGVGTGVGSVSHHMSTAIGDPLRLKVWDASAEPSQEPARKATKAVALREVPLPAGLPLLLAGLGWLALLRTGRNRV